MILSRRPNDFVHRNLFLQALSGILSYAGKLERLCAIEVSEERAAPDEHAVLVALGALALGNAVRRIASETNATGGRDTPPSGAPLDVLPRILR